MYLMINFAEAEGGASGIGAFNINLKGFLFQLLTFVLVLLVLKRWVFPKLISTLEARRQTLEQSLKDADKTREALAKAENDVSKLLAEARDQADQALADAAAQGKDVVAKAEAAAQARANRLLDEAKTQIDQERNKLRAELKNELSSLVVTATEKVLSSKINDAEDKKLIERTIKEMR